MLSKTFINRKLSSIEKDLKRLERCSSLEIEEVLSSYAKQTITEKLMERMVNQAIDINKYIIEILIPNKTPSDYEETFLMLADLGVYKKDFGEKISQSTRFRNILIYDIEDPKLLYPSIFACLEDYKYYLKALTDFLN